MSSLRSWLCGCAVCVCLVALCVQLDNRQRVKELETMLADVVADVEQLAAENSAMAYDLERLINEKD